MNRTRPKRAALGAESAGLGPGRSLALALIVHLLVGAETWAQKLPTVGDPIELVFPLETTEWVTVERTDRFEVVSRVGGRVVIRSFEPGTFVLRATIESSEGDSRVEERTVTVASVLSENDSLEPAPLEPPRPLPPNRVATSALAAAGLLCLVAWVALFLSTREPRKAESQPMLSAVDELRRSLHRIEGLVEGDERLIELGSAIRRYLSRVEPALGDELTSSEILGSLEARMLASGVISAIREVLDEADYAKFSGFRGRGDRYRELSGRAWLVTHVVSRGEAEP